jgi:hypothetical protein
MNHREAFSTVADEITDWQIAAQQLPMTELCAMTATCQQTLAETLIAFNIVCLSHADGDEPTAEAMQALGEVTRQATAAAILALGISHRARLAAQRN